MDTITAVHSARFLEDPGARNCNLDGNPLHEEQIEIAGMVGRILAVNTVIDEHRRLSYVNFGEIVESHLAAVSFLEDYAIVPVGRRFSTVLTTGAGYPLDKTYYQTVKGMVGALDLLAEGGSLFIASECSEGLGSSSFIDVQKRFLSSGMERFRADYGAKAHADVDEWMTGQQVRCMLRGSVHLFSGLPPEDARLTGTAPVKSLLMQLAESRERTADASIAVIPEGPYVIPVFKP
jgi:nickel-dependent lactate racemase